MPGFRKISNLLLLLYAVSRTLSDASGESEDISCAGFLSQSEESAKVRSSTRTIDQDTHQSSGYSQKGVDVLLSVDLVRLSWSKTIDKAVLVTGDSDFVPAVQTSKDAGTIVELYYSESQHVSDELFQACDERHPISKALLESCSL